MRGFVQQGPPVHAGPYRDDPGCLALSYTLGSSFLLAPCTSRGELWQQAVTGEAPSARTKPWLSRDPSGKSRIRAYHALQKSIPWMDREWDDPEEQLGHT